ncbi:MAG: hypothetical protein KAT76_03840 [Bacteroidales bacterium]|nr:hypothetical protein [Bacteroidales bacterium]
MKRVLPFILMMITSLLAFAQEDPFYDGSLYNRYNPMYSPGGFGGLSTPVSYTTDKKMDVGVQLGTSFSTDFNKGFSFSTMVSPEIRYRLNNRLTIRGGISVANTEYGNTLLYSPYGINRYSGNITQGMLYVSGDYMISPKVVLSGTAYKEFSIGNDGPENAFRPGYDGKGVMMNLRLMPTENMMIDIGAEIYEGNNPYRGGIYNPYNRPFVPRW